jgi:hypothetical protein
MVRARISVNCMGQDILPDAAHQKIQVNNGGTSTILGEVRQVSWFVMEEEVVIVHPIGNSVSVCALNAYQGVIQTIGTTPPGMMCIEVTHNDGWE